MCNSTNPEPTTPPPPVKSRSTLALLLSAVLLLATSLVALTTPLYGLKDSIIDLLLSVSIAVTVVYGPQIVGYFIRPSLSKLPEQER